MGILSNLKGVISAMFNKTDVTKQFGITVPKGDIMTSKLTLWGDLYTNSSTNLAAVIASEAARLVTNDMNISISGGIRAETISNIVSYNRDCFRNKLELGCVYGGLMIKPNGLGLDFIPPSKYTITSYDDNHKVNGCIFEDDLTINNLYYTRLEYHHFVKDDLGNAKYVIENKCYESNNNNTLGHEVPLSRVDKWSALLAKIEFDNISKPLFGYFKMPSANNIDINSPLGVSIFSRSVDAIRDFDMWYAKWRHEGLTSDKVLFINSQSMTEPGATGKDRFRTVNPLPNLVKGLEFGQGATRNIEEWVPDIRVEEFKLAMQTQLDLISVQCGFSSGYFSFDARTGSVTATQVESEDQRTYSTCTDIQVNYKNAIEDALYALDVFISLYTELPVEKLDFSIYMKDLFVNVNEERSRAYQLSKDKYIPKWKYLVDYEGYTEEEAKRLVAEAESVDINNNINNNINAQLKEGLNS